MNAKRFHARLATALVVATLGATGPSTAASAQDGYRIDTAGGQLQVRSGPGTGYSPVRLIDDGKPVDISCQTTGTKVDGTYGTSNIWDKIGPGQYVADAYVWTGHDGKFLKACGSSTNKTKLVNDYPYKGQRKDQSDKWGFFKTECVSFAAFRVVHHGRPDFRNRYHGQHFGNANTWDDAARALGIRVDKKPAAGAVAQWNTGRFGHVAWVAKVHPNGTVTI